MQPVPLKSSIFFGLCALTVQISADELSGMSTTDAIDSPTEIVQHLSEAMHRIHSVDVEFVRYTYDLVFENTIIAKGRLVCESGSRQFMSLEPFEPAAGTRAARLKKSGVPYDVGKGHSERFILTKEGAWSIDDDVREGTFMQIPAKQRAQPTQDSVKSIFDLWTCFGKSLLGGFATFGQIAGPVAIRPYGSTLLDTDLEKRFRLTISKNTKACVVLSLFPRFPEDEVSFSRIDLLLSRESWLPDAVQLYDPAGTTVTAYIIEKRRINECAETVEHLFHPDLTNYKVSGYDRISTTSTTR